MTGTPVDTLPPLDSGRMAIHTMTTRSLGLERCLEAYGKIGAGGISIWRQTIEPIGIRAAVQLVESSRMRVPALVRGGFFPAHNASDRDRAIQDTLASLDDAAALNAEMLVLVAGAVPGMPLTEGRQQVLRGMEAILPRAQELSIKLALEPLHPIYAADRSCVNTIAQARAILDDLDHPLTGVAVDVYHTWWDPELAPQIAALGREQRLFAFHVCDWKVERADDLNDRGLMGEGVIDIRGIRRMVEDAGFDGMIEVEVFNEDHWAGDQELYLEQIRDAWLEHV